MESKSIRKYIRDNFERVKTIEDALDFIQRWGHPNEFMDVPIGVHINGRGVYNLNYLKMKNKNFEPHPKKYHLYFIGGEVQYKYNNRATIKEEYLKNNFLISIDIDNGEQLNVDKERWFEFIFEFVRELENKWGLFVAGITFSSGIGYDKPLKCHLHIPFYVQYNPKVGGDVESWNKLKDCKEALAYIVEWGLQEFAKNKELPPFPNGDSKLIINPGGIVDIKVAMKIHQWIALPGSYNLKKYWKKEGKPVFRLGYCRLPDEPTLINNLKKLAEAYNLVKNGHVVINKSKASASQKKNDDEPSLPNYNNYQIEGGGDWLEKAKEIKWESILKLLPPSVRKWVKLRLAGKASEWCGGEGHELRLKVATYLAQNWARISVPLYYVAGHKLFSLMDDYNYEKTQYHLEWVLQHPFHKKIDDEKHIAPLVKKFIEE